MPKPKAPTRNVVVSGDITVDWNLARSGEHGIHAYWSSGRQTKASWQPGGAALLGSLVERLVEDCFAGQVKVWRPRIDPNNLGRPGEGYCASFSLWSEHLRTTKKDEKAKVWRVEQYLGADPAEPRAPVRPDPPDAPAKGCELVILDDAGLTFHSHPDAWPRAITGASRPAILLKISAWQDAAGNFRHLGQGGLFEHLLTKHGDRLTVLANVNDLRLRDAAISRDMSWERLASDLARELLYNPCMAPLARCAHVVVRLGAAGVFLYSRNGGQPTCRLFFDPYEIEDSWERRRPGGVVGYTVCMAAAIARQMLAEPKHPDWQMAFQTGMGALRVLHEHGFELDRGPMSSGLRFPLEVVAKEIAREMEPDGTWQGVDLCETPVPPIDPGGPRAQRTWTILGDRYQDVLAKAEELVRRGPENALRLGQTSTISVPLAHFGALKTVDRQEIENLRSIGRLVQEYCVRRSQKAPLSFAVFGPPGCGKSFAIEQLAGTLIPGRTEKLTFNLSQFESPAELGEAFHQVRDAALRGAMPLVFWDEFDANLSGLKLGWLKYFLAPMQDGCFQAGPLTHPVGPAIFAFAGSVCPSMQAFESHIRQPGLEDAKGKDFLSRLKGFVNILGPDSQDPISDPHYIIRRALILRETLNRERPMLFDDKGELRIDAGVLRALLFVSRYHHGVRSLTSVISMSVLDGKLKFERSCLPAAAQLDLHVDAAEFLAITNGVQFADLDSAKIECMAREVHRAFYAYLKRKGYRYGAQTDDRKKTHTSVRRFEDLPVTEQEENRKFARSIPNRLVAIGYVVGVMPAGGSPGVVPPGGIESMAEMEHERWMWGKLAASWRYAPRTDKSNRLHSCLLTWRHMSEGERRLRYGVWADALGERELPEKEKEKDRILVRAIPRILKSAGLQVVPIPVK
jgi:hypothetical protein